MAIADLDKAKAQAGCRVGTTISCQAARMVEESIGYCEGMTPYAGRDQIAAALRAEIPQVHDYFRHSLAIQLARCLTQLDDSVVGIYSYSYGDAEEEGEDRNRGVAANLNLVLHVRRKTAALAAAVASMDQALLEQYRQLIAPRGERMSSFLDVQMVDDRDVEEATGFGVVLRGIYSRPVRLWPE